MRTINTFDAPAAIGPYSQGVEVNGFCFLSGQIALTSDGVFLDEDVTTQTMQVLRNIEALLLSQNLSKNNVVKTTIFLSDMADFETVNLIYGEFFGSHKPARSTIEVAKLPKNAKVEIEVIATMQI